MVNGAHPFAYHTTREVIWCFRDPVSREEEEPCTENMTVFPHYRQTKLIINKLHVEIFLLRKEKRFETKIPFCIFLTLLNFLSLVSTTSEAALFSFFFLSHSSLSFSCFNPRNKNTTTSATVRFVTLHNQIRLAPSLCYLGFSLSSQLWPNPWAPPPFLAVALTCATTTTSNHWPPLSLSAFISTFPSSVFGCI